MSFARALVRPIARAVAQPITGGDGWSPQSLYVSGRVGPLYEPSPTTCYSDFLGTPAAVGDSVALQLDTSQGRLRMGSQLSTGGDDLNTAANWTASGTNTVAQDGDEVVITYVDDANGALLDISGLTDYGLYRLTGTLTATGAFNFGTTNNRTSLTVQGCTAGANEIEVFFVSDGSTRFAFTGFSSGNVARLSSMSLRQVLGYHAYQDTTAARPLLGRWPVTGRRNLVSNNVDITAADGYSRGNNTTLTPMPNEVDPFGNTGTVYRMQGAAVSGVFVNFYDTNKSSPQPPAGSVAWSIYVKAFATSSNINISSLVDGGTLNIETMNADETWQHAEIAATATGSNRHAFAITSSGGLFAVDILFCLPQLEVGSSATAVQRVNEDIDITEAGVQSAYFLRGDGVDDYLEATVPEVTAGHTLALVASGNTGSAESQLTISDSSTDDDQIIVAASSVASSGVEAIARDGPVGRAVVAFAGESVRGMVADFAGATTTIAATNGGVGSTSTDQAIAAGMTVLRVLGVGDSTPAVFPGDIYFAASIDASITDAERTALLDYMRAETPA